jgi:ribonuclease HI
VNQTYRIFTDGSAIGNPGPGGWGGDFDAGERTLGDVGRPFLDDHLGDGVVCSGAGTSATSRPGARRTAFRLGIPHLNAKLHIRWIWIKGHNGHLDQTRADTLAHEAARALWVQQKAAA